MGQGVPEPSTRKRDGVKAALIPWDDAPNLRDNCHFPICGVIGGPYLCVLGPSVMSSSTLRILGSLALALSAFAVANGAEAGLVRKRSRLVRTFIAVQTVQFGGSNCYYADGWNGRGWYQCGNEWNDGFGWIGPFNLNTFGGSAIRRHHPHGVIVSHPRAPNPVYPRLDPPRRLAPAAPSAVGHSFRLGVPQARIALAPAAFTPRLVSTPAPRPSPPGLPAADSTAALAAAIFITFTAPEFPTSARLSRPALLPAAVCMG